MLICLGYLRLVIAKFDFFKYLMFMHNLDFPTRLNGFILCKNSLYVVYTALFNKRHGCKKVNKWVEFSEFFISTQQTLFIAVELLVLSQLKIYNKIKPFKKTTL